MTLNPQQFRVEVDHTDRTRNEDGQFNINTHVIEVAAAHEQEAHLLAAQMIAARWDERTSGMVTATRTVPEEGWE